VNDRDVDPLLEQIDRPSVACDAGTTRALDDLASDEYVDPADLVELVAAHGRAPYWQRPIVELVEPRADPMRGWLARWIDRVCR